MDSDVRGVRIGSEGALSALIIGSLAGRAHASIGLRRQFGIMHDGGQPSNIGRAMTEALAVTQLASVISDALNKCRTSDGRVDTRDVADYIANRIAPRSSPKTLPQMVDNAVMITAFARLITEAIETRMSSTGDLDTRDVAAHIFGELQRFQR